MVPRCLPLYPVSQFRGNYLPIKAESLNAWQTLDVHFKRCDSSKAYLKWKLWSHWRYNPALFFLPYKVYMEFLSFPFVTPIGCRYPVGWLRTFMGKIRTRASSLLKSGFSFSNKPAGKRVHVWYFTLEGKGRANYKEGSPATSFKQHHLLLLGSAVSGLWVQRDQGVGCWVPRNTTVKMGLNHLSIPNPNLLWMMFIHK